VKRDRKEFESQVEAQMKEIDDERQYNKLEKERLNMMYQELEERTSGGGYRNMPMQSAKKRVVE